jgi:hypothetical protein
MNLEMGLEVQPPVSIGFAVRTDGSPLYWQRFRGISILDNGTEHRTRLGKERRGEELAD